MARFSIIKPTEYAVGQVKEIQYGILRSRFTDRKVKAESILPFRVKFTGVDIPGYGRQNPAPIGIAVIGTNNYIL